MIELKPIRISFSEWDEIEEKIKILFKKEIYLPILKEISESSKVLKNTSDDLLEALRSGRLTFYRGKFSGKFSASLSRELRALGAKWDRGQKCYSLVMQNLPLDIRNVIAASESNFLRKLAKIDERLRKIVPEQLAGNLKISKLFDRTLWKVEKEFQKSVQNITVAPVLKPEARQRIADEWQNNMDLWIRKFTEEQIIKLRKDVHASTFEGNRYGSLVQTIQESYGVTAKKAKFLARQETNLLMAKFKEVRYADAGVREYKWQCVHGTPQHPVRPRHKQLNDLSKKGTTFRFDDPPVTSEPGQAQRRNNPGEDYNCRCTAIPIVRFKK